QIDVESELAAGCGLELKPAALAHHVDLHGLERPHAAAPIAEEALRRHRVDALASFLVGARHPEDVGPLGPRIVGRAIVGWPRKELELVDGDRALPMHRAQAVGARVTAADDDNTFALSADEALVGNVIALAAAIL